MTNLWPWLLVAAAGALHGLNPAGAWGLALVAGLRSGEPWQALRALGPIALGHLASVALVAAAAVLGLSLPGHRVPLGVAGLGLLALATVCLCRHRGVHHVPAGAGPAGLALGSFLLSTLHGAGLALVPVLMPLCLVGGASGSDGIAQPLYLALAAFGLHTASMLLVSGALAAVVCRAASMLRARAAARSP